MSVGRAKLTLLMLQRARCRVGVTYVLVHQTGLTDTAVAKDDDLEENRDVLEPMIGSWRSEQDRERTLSKTFLRDAMIASCGGGLAVKERSWMRACEAGAEKVRMVALVCCREEVFRRAVVVRLGLIAR